MTRRLSRASFRYGIALLTGRANRARSGSDAEQVRSYRRGQARNNAVSRVAMTVLDYHATSPWLRVLYVGFALQADRICRRFTGLTMENELRFAIGRWEARGMERGILEEMSEEIKRLSGLVPREGIEE